MTEWIWLSLVSALFLGVYDIAKKASVKENAVPIVLLASVSVAAAFWLLLVLLSAFVVANDHWLYPVGRISSRIHGLLFLKSALVGASWACAFFALKQLPLSIAAPIRATSPLFTILLAVLFWAESPSALQWIGIVIVLFAAIMFSRAGVEEGIHFHRDRYVGLMLSATVLGAISALYDKHLLQSEMLKPTVVQAWFSIYLVPVMLPLAFRWWKKDRQETPFQWRWSILLIPMFLLIADIVYFTAITYPGAMISVISPLRRASIIIPFAFGILRLKEKNWKPKTICVAMVIVGVYLMSQK